MKKMEIPASKSRPAWSYLYARYEHPVRYYHGLKHLITLFEHQLRFGSKLVFPEAYCFSVFYHDLIYDPLRTDNEVKSAAYAVELLDSWGKSKEFIEKVELLILSTEGHQPRWEHADCRLFLDLDLAILGSERENYAAYAHQIREEYRIYPDGMYRKGRRKVLLHFLDRKEVYFSPEIRNLWEAKARANLLWELDILKAKGTEFNYF